MNRLIRCTLICIFTILPSIANSQNNCLDRKLLLRNGHTTLKATLKQLSNQTDCVFSYDPTKIQDTQEINISSKGSLTLRLALSKVLPKGIQYKTTGKYIVLQKTTNTSVNDQPTKKLKKKAIKKPESFISPFVKLIIDSTEYKTNTDTVATPEITTANQPIADKPDTLPMTQAAVESNLSNIIQNTTFSKSDTTKLSTAKLKVSSSILALQVSANNHLVTVSSQIGLNNIYGIISVGSDYYKSYHLGLGVGMYFQLYKQLGANIDLIQYAIAAGKSKQVNIKAYTTEISPALNYRIGNRLKIAFGPTVYSIKSRYSKGTSTTDLGRYFGYGGMVGISYNFK